MVHSLQNAVSTLKSENEDEMKGCEMKIYDQRTHAKERYALKTRKPGRKEIF